MIKLSPHLIRQKRFFSLPAASTLEIYYTLYDPQETRSEKSEQSKGTYGRTRKNNRYNLIIATSTISIIR